MLRIISWNVNGLRSVVKKGFLAWLQASGADIVCLQETRVDEAQVPEEVRAVPGYFCHFVAGEKKGYSGVGMLSRIPPREIASGIGIPRFDGDGRIQVAQFEGFRLYNIYFPNGKMGPERLQFKMDFYEAFLAAVDPLVKKGERLVVVGDFNTAHREIDLARPKENSKVSGFLPEERAWMDRFVEHGFVDTFRLFTSEGGHYSWWDMKSRARERNVGWRIDYVFVTENLRERVRDAFILEAVMGSDHCPVGADLDL